MAGRVVRAQAALVALGPVVLEILRAGRQDAHWPWVLALPADSHAHREAVDSNSVWEPSAKASRLLAHARPLQASVSQAQEKLRVERSQERLQAALRLQAELAVAPQEQLDALAAWQQLRAARE
jgi:hypothetical protein